MGIFDGERNCDWCRKRYNIVSGYGKHNIYCSKKCEVEAGNEKKEKETSKQSSSANGNNDSGIISNIFALSFTLTMGALSLLFQGAKKYPKTAVGIVASMIIISIISSVVEHKKINSEMEIITADAAFPKEELAFINLSNSSKIRIKENQNKLKPEFLAEQINKEFFQIIPNSLQIINWEGELIEVDSYKKDGKQIGFNIRLTGSKIFFTNHGIDFGDLDKFSIKDKTQAFEKIKSIPINTKVKFSGKIANSEQEFKERNIEFAKDNEKDRKYLFELTNIEIK